MTVLVKIVMTIVYCFICYLFIHFTYLMRGGKMSSTKQKPIRKVNIKYKKLSAQLTSTLFISKLTDTFPTHFCCKLI